MNYKSEGIKLTPPAGGGGKLVIESLKWDHAHCCSVKVWISTLSVRGATRERGRHGVFLI